MAALPGFLLVFTAEGKLLYLSESVSEHLGHSMVSADGDPPPAGPGHRWDTTSFLLLNLRITGRKGLYPERCYWSRIGS